MATADEKQQNGRRSFLKLTTAAGAMLGANWQGTRLALAAGDDGIPLGAVTSKEKTIEQFPYTLPVRFGDKQAELPDKVVRNGCPYCNSQCRIMVWVKDGRAVNNYGDPKDIVQDGRLCPKGQSTIQMGYNKYRILKPLKRVGPRGSGKFREISWDQAYDEIAQKLLEIRDKHGAHTIVIEQTTRQEEEGFGIFERFGEMIGTPNIDSGGPQCNDTGKYAVAMRAGVGKFSNGFGFDPISGQHDLESTKYLLMLGANMAEQRVVVSGHVLENIVKKGAKMVVVDPILNPWGMQANEWVPIRPGTDMAMVYGMIHEIVNNGWVDHDFIKNWTIGYDELVKFVNEKGYSPKWASEMTGIPEADIKRIAREYATTKPASLWTNHGIAGHCNATQNFGMIFILTAITGNIGVPGGGALFMNNRGFDFDMPDLKHGKPPETAHKPGLLLPTAIEDAILHGKPYPIKAVFNAASWTTMRQNSKKIQEAYLSPNLELSVWTTIWPRVHGMFADYILPEATGYEKDNIGDRRDDRAIRWRNKVVEPMGEAKPIVSIWIDLAHHIAKFDKKYPKEYWTENLPARFHDKKTYWNEGVGRAGTSGGLTWQRLDKSDNPIAWPCPGKDHPATKALRPEQLVDGEHPGTKVQFLDHPAWKLLWANDKFPEGRRFPNDHNKIIIYTKEFDDKLKALGHSALPEYFTSPANPYGHRSPVYTDEYVVNPWRGKLVRKVKWGKPDPAMMQKFPHSLTSARPSAPTQHGYSMWMPGLLQLAPDQFAMMHPELAARYGLKTGDKVKVETHIGSMVLPALVWPGIEKNTVQVPAHFEKRNLVRKDLGLDMDAVDTPNQMMDNYGDTVGGAQEYKAHWCRITKA
ncbi:MAG: molybdopterin-dependent oxidoreductase [Sulfuricella sp.]|nr:molybdopterin-dependent oxidoreductase [Sulfuricella sp.]